MRFFSITWSFSNISRQDKSQKDPEVDDGDDAMREVVLPTESEANAL